MSVGVTRQTTVLQKREVTELHLASFKKHSNPVLLPAWAVCEDSSLACCYFFLLDMFDR